MLYKKFDIHASYEKTAIYRHVATFFLLWNVLKSEKCWIFSSGSSSGTVAYKKSPTTGVMNSSLTFFHNLPPFSPPCTLPLDFLHNNFHFQHHYCHHCHHVVKNLQYIFLKFELDRCFPCHFAHHCIHHLLHHAELTPSLKYQGQWPPLFS